MQLDLFSSVDIKEKKPRFLIECCGQIKHLIYTEEILKDMLYIREETDEESVIRFLARNHSVSEVDARKAIQKAKENYNTWVTYQELAWEDYIF